LDRSPKFDQNLGKTPPKHEIWVKIELEINIFSQIGKLVGEIRPTLQTFKKHFKNSDEITKILTKSPKFEQKHKIFNKNTTKLIKKCNKKQVCSFISPI